MLTELLRFGGAAIINTIFGYGLYAALVWIGMNLYVAQLLAQIGGALFNFRTYSVAFRTRASRTRFLASYGVSYLAGLLFLIMFHTLTRDAYVAGLLTMVAAALFNFLILKRFVFRSGSRTVPEQKV